MANVTAPAAEKSDEEVYGAVADYFADSRFDLDTFLQRFARKEKMSSRRVGEEWRALARDIREGKKQSLINLYIHLPFCRQVCGYCGYFTLVPEVSGDVSKYLEILADEARFFADALGKTRIRNLFVGGGTPSFLNNGQLKYFLDNVLSPFRYFKDGQRTIDCDPSSLTPEKIELLKGGVIRRVSLGVESLDAAVLGAQGRTHSGAEASLGAVRMLKEHDFAHDLNCDLILGLAGETPESFLRSFCALFEEGVSKVIVYALKPVPAYLAKFHGGDREKFDAHYRGLLSAVEEPMKKIAAESGYVCHSNSDVVWYFIERGDIPGSPIHRYEDDSSIQPLSVMGLGSSARSRIYGRARYAQAHRLLKRFDPDEEIFLGRISDERGEMVRMILTGLRNQRRISLGKFRAKFGGDFVETFRAAVDGLAAAGKARVEDGCLVLKTEDPREIMLAGMRFVGRPEIEATFGDVLAGRPVAGDGSAPADIQPARVEAAAGVREEPEALAFHLGAQGRGLAKAQVRRLIREAYEGGCRALTFLGGDPAEHSGIVDGVEYARGLGYERVSFCLDGGRWARREFLEKLLRAGADRLDAVIHGHTAEVEGGVTGDAEVFALKRAGLGHLRDLVSEGRLREPVTLHAVVCAANLPRLEEYVRHYRAAGFEDFRFHYASPQFGIRLDAASVPGYRDAMRRLLRLMMLNESEWKLRMTLGGVPPCMLRRRPAGEMSLRLFHHLAQRYLSAPEAWTDPRGRHASLCRGRDRRARHAKRIPPECGGCIFLGVCEGVWNFYADIHGLAEITPVVLP